MWVLIVNEILIKLPKALITIHIYHIYIYNLNHHLPQISFCLCLQHPGIVPLAVYFDTFVENLIRILFYLSINKIKAAHDEKFFLGIKVYLAHGIEGFVLLCDISLFLRKSLIQFLGGKNNLHSYSQSDFHLIHLADIRRSYLIYFQVCNMLKILHNENLLTHNRFG